MKVHFSDTAPRNTDDPCSYSGAIRPALSSANSSMPSGLHQGADDGTGDEMVVFSDAVPTAGPLTGIRKPPSLRAAMGIRFIPKRSMQTTRQMLRANPFSTLCGQCTLSSRQSASPWLDAPGRKVKLPAAVFPASARLMHKWVRHYATFNEFADAVWGSFEKPCPTNGRNSGNGNRNFRVISAKYKVI